MQVVLELYTFELNVEKSIHGNLNNFVDRRNATVFCEFAVLTLHYLC